MKSQKEKEIIYDAVETLGLFPNCANVKKLSDRNDYRLRVGKWRIMFTAAADMCIEAAKKVSVHRAPHLFCCRALEVQKYVCAPDALHLRHPVNAYNWVV